MKVALKITIEGLLRALRAREHRLVEDIEARRAGRKIAGQRGHKNERLATGLSERNGDGSGT